MYNYLFYNYLFVDKMYTSAKNKMDLHVIAHVVCNNNKTGGKLNANGTETVIIVARNKNANENFIVSSTVHP